VKLHLESSTAVPSITDLSFPASPPKSS
jgi:hypothetical protein